LRGLAKLDGQKIAPRAREGHEVRKEGLLSFSFLNFVFLLENSAGEALSRFMAGVSSVIPACSAGIQVDMDVSGRILRTWMPASRARHDGGRPCPLVFIFCRRAQAHETLLGKKESKKDLSHSFEMTTQFLSVISSAARNPSHSFRFLQASVSS
jgi:hypothetical protein